MEVIYDVDLALAHYKLEDLYSESGRYRRIKEAKQNRPAWYNRWTKHNKPEETSATAKTGYKSNLHSA
jgi:hypothetical protein